MRRETIQRVATPAALLVGVAEPLATLLVEALADSGLRVLRVGHAAAASERIPVIMPQLVILGGPLHPSELEMLTDRCVAVGAELLQAPPPKSDLAAFVQAAKSAASLAKIKAARAADQRRS